MVFPTMFVSLAWTFLVWRFTGQPIQLGATNPDLFTFRDSFGAAALTVGVALLHVPLYLAVAVIYVARRPAALTGYVVRWWRRRSPCGSACASPRSRRTSCSR
jgi:hypothetical protein